MTLFRDFDLKDNISEEGLSFPEKYSVYYHNLFDYPLTFNEFIKWSCGVKLKIKSELKIVSKNGYSFISGREGLVYKRNIRKRYSEKKIAIAKKAAGFLRIIPTIKMIGVTGSVAMYNADRYDDIDLLIITSKGKLWTTRLIAYLLLKLFGFKLRKPFLKDVNNKLCLNMWIDESDLIWKKSARNIYTAHEILQIIPLFTKDGVYDSFMSANGWALKYWPNALGKKHYNIKYNRKKITKFDLFEKAAFCAQIVYMKPRKTREVITRTRAIFHPVDLSKVVFSKLDP